MAQGLFIVLEGLDGAGTTTQAQRLVHRLEAAGRPAHLTREPSDGPIGRVLREVLAGRLETAAGEAVEPATVALLFAADRLDHLQREIAPLLRAGIHVVSDRYLASSFAYQGSELDPGWVRSINARARPADETLLLEVTPEVAEARRLARGGPPERYDVREAQERIARAYADVCREEALLGPVHRLDGARPPDEVEAAIWAVIGGRLSASPRGPAHGA